MDLSYRVIGEAGHSFPYAHYLIFSVWGWFCIFSVIQDNQLGLI